MTTRTTPWDHVRDDVLFGRAPTSHEIPGISHEIPYASARFHEFPVEPVIRPLVQTDRR